MCLRSDTERVVCLVDGSGRITASTCVRLLYGTRGGTIGYVRGDDRRGRLRGATTAALAVWCRHVGSVVVK